MPCTGGVTTPRIALGGFATTNWVLVVSTLAVGVAPSDITFATHDDKLAKAARAAGFEVIGR